MIIRSFHIDGFGLFGGAGIETLEPGLILICAENGGGKTTLRDFFRAMLFGLPRGGNKYSPFSSTAHGGRLSFQTKNGEIYHLSRSFTPGRIVLNRDDGQTVSDLAPVLSNASLDLYKNIFAIGLPELQDAQVLDSEQVKAMIGGAGSGHSGRALLTALKELNSEMEDRFKKSGQVPLINKLLTTLESDQVQLKRNVAEAECYWDYEKELAELDGTLGELKDAEKAAQSDYAHLVLLQKAWGDWVHLQGHQRELESLLPRVESFPERGAARLADNTKALAACDEETRRLGEEAAAKRQQRDAVTVSEDLLAQGVAIDTVHGGLALFEQNRQDLVRHRAEVSRLARQVNEGLQSLGSWPVERLEQFDDSLPAMAEKMAAADGLKSAQAGLLQCRLLHQGLERDGVAAENAWKQAREQLAAQWPQLPPTHEWLEEKSQTLNRIRAALIELAALREAVQEVGQETAEAATRIGSLEADLERARGEKPQSFPFRACAIALLGAAVVIAALSYRNLAVAALALVFGIAGFALFWKAGASSTTSDPSTQPLERELADWRERHRLLFQKAQAQEERLQALKTGIASLAQQFNRAVLSAADCDEIQVVLQRQRNERREWDAAEAKVKDLEQRVQETKRRLQESGDELARLEAEVEAARVQWAAWLEKRQLDGRMLPETFDNLHRQLQQSRRDKLDLDAARGQEARIDQAIAAYREQVTAILVALHRTVPVDDKIAGTVMGLVSERETARQAVGLRVSLIEKIEALGAEETRSMERRQGLEQERQQLLLEGQAETSEEFLVRSAAWEERCRLDAAIRSRLQNLETLSAPGEKLRQLLLELEATDYEQLQSSVSEAEQHHQEITDRLSEHYHRHGQLTQALKDLATGDDVADLAQKVTGEQCELQELAEEWAVRRLGFWLMEKARTKFQEERQPAVLRDAGTYLSTISGGEFTRVVQPLGTEDYHLQRADGSIKEGRDYWNTGLKEQTYLSLRLGLIDDYSTRAEPLPIILDDALVNFDPARLEGAVTSIYDFAERHQVFYFTCHAHTVDLFAKQERPFSVYQIKSGLFENCLVS